MGIEEAEKGEIEGGESSATGVVVAVIDDADIEGNIWVE